MELTASTQINFVQDRKTVRRLFDGGDLCRRKNDWLQSAGVKEGQAFSLEGFFDMPAADVYQFQVRSNVRPVVEVDGRTVRSIADPRWAFLPLSLAKGTYRLLIKGVAVKNPLLDIRFGGPGTQGLDVAGFHHLKSALPVP